MTEATGERPGLSVVVLSLGAPRSLVDAVASLHAQQPRPEVIVVNSGGGDARALLQRAALDVPVVEHPARLMPGGARNAGIDRARGRYIAFLADDCRAEPGWVAARLAAHARGAASVASALVCDRPDHPVALAAHLSLFVHRLPGIDAAHAQRCGASYDRLLFEKHGRFRDDLRSGEDTEWHRRLAADDRPVWARDVVTVHHSPTSLVALLRGQHARGRRAAAAWQTIAGRSRTRVARTTLRSIRVIWTRAPRALEGRHAASLIVALPLVVLAVVAYAWGALQAGAHPDTAPASRRG